MQSRFTVDDALVDTAERSIRSAIEPRGSRAGTRPAFDNDRQKGSAKRRISSNVTSPRSKTSNRTMPIHEP